MSSCSSEPAQSQVHGSAGCCGATVVFDGASPAYRRVLAWVIAINLLGFCVVAGGAILAGSASLAANTLDFAADAATYALSLWAIGKSARIRAGAALFKGGSLAVMAVAILGFAVWRAVSGTMPDAAAISGLGLFGAAANLVAAILLLRYREGDANVRSVWLCTRNDLIQCVAVAATGVAVALTGSRWPDLAVGVLLAAIFLRSAWSITTQASRELEAEAAQTTDFVTHSRAARRGL
ncbi:MULTISPECIES: cation transporter [unclassified Phenylobacterium]|uniref:cation transporter n=1 Tax=unclassified Phenylobacterium TaxID=2640670 RepID=UPI00083A8636|nr:MULTISPECIES: cation transporter [unclassified Phenylobacterium]